MTRSLAILALCCLLCTLSSAQEEDHQPRDWELHLSIGAIEQHDGLIYNGSLGGQLANAVVLGIPVGESLFLRLSGRRIDWSTNTVLYDGREVSKQKGFGLGAGLEKRWNPTPRLAISAGAEIGWQRSQIEGYHVTNADGEVLSIDHAKEYTSISPVFGISYSITSWLAVRIETSASVGIVRSYTDSTSDEADVYTDAMLRPISLFGLTVRI